MLLLLRHKSWWQVNKFVKVLIIVAGSVVVTPESPLQPSTTPSTGGLVPVTSPTVSAGGLRYTGLQYGLVDVQLNLNVAGQSAAAPTFPATATTGSYTVVFSMADNLGTAFGSITDERIVHRFASTTQRDSFHFEAYIPYVAARTYVELQITFTNNLTGGDNVLRFLAATSFMKTTVVI